MNNYTDIWGGRLGHFRVEISNVPLVRNFVQYVWPWFCSGSEADRQLIIFEYSVLQRISYTAAIGGEPRNLFGCTIYIDPFFTSQTAQKKPKP